MDSDTSQHGTQLASRSTIWQRIQWVYISVVGIAMQKKKTADASQHGTYTASRCKTWRHIQRSYTEISGRELQSEQTQDI